MVQVTAHLATYSIQHDDSIYNTLPTRHFKHVIKAVVSKIERREDLG